MKTYQSGKNKTSKEQPYFSYQVDVIRQQVRCGVKLVEIYCGHLRRVQVLSVSEWLVYRTQAQSQMPTQVSP